MSCGEGLGDGVGEAPGDGDADGEGEGDAGGGDAVVTTTRIDAVASDVPATASKR